LSYPFALLAAKGLSWCLCVFGVEFVIGVVWCPFCSQLRVRPCLLGDRKNRETDSLVSAACTSDVHGTNLFQSNPIYRQSPSKAADQKFSGFIS
jgi:hypothetical protein